MFIRSKCRWSMTHLIPPPLTIHDIKRYVTTCRRTFQSSFLLQDSCFSGTFSSIWSSSSISYRCQSIFWYSKTWKSSAKSKKYTTFSMESCLLCFSSTYFSSDLELLFITMRFLWVNMRLFWLIILVRPSWWTYLLF